MTSEEVKELLRQLSKDTEEVGDIRSRTVRIRLNSDEEETPSGEDETAAGEEKEQIRLCRILRISLPGPTPRLGRKAAGRKADGGLCFRRFLKKWQPGKRTGQSGAVPQKKLNRQKRSRLKRLRQTNR